MDSTISPRRIDELLTRYGEHHQHPMNELIHCVCVPAIVFAVLGLCWLISPAVALLVAAAALAYYLRLSPPLSVGMLAMSALMLVVLARLPAGAVLPVSVVVFVLAWIGQFVGHRIE
ncbi:Mpo1-like protein, partial [Klebsiella pneumoniae]|uniref:Mpo1-like protein n=2 Tax=Pseudomonadota TaxID=1224 RepID=UPI001BD021F0